MSDYYCPHCGADLEDQYGFDPNAGYWTCTVCGQFLIDPESSDDSDRFDGVGWFCDGCGAYLNKQSGFSDWYSTWTCTECGYTNNISEDEIYDSEEDYQRHRDENEYSGGILGAILKEVVQGLEEAASNYGSSDDEEDDGYDEEDDDYDEDDDDEIESNYGSTTTYYDPEAVRWQQEREQKQSEMAAHQAEIAKAKKDKRKARFKRIWSAFAHKKMIDVNIKRMCWTKLFESDCSF